MVRQRRFADPARCKGLPVHDQTLGDTVVLLGELSEHGFHEGFLQ